MMMMMVKCGDVTNKVYNGCLHLVTTLSKTLVCASPSLHRDDDDHVDHDDDHDYYDHDHEDDDKGEEREGKFSKQYVSDFPQIEIRFSLSFLLL